MNHKELAEHRAELLWQRYHENGDHLTCKEVFEITSKRVSNLYLTFQTHGVAAPPVWDTKTAIRARQVAALQAKADELGRNWLTAAEAAEAAGVSKANICNLRNRLSGERIPQIRNETNRKSATRETPQPKSKTSAPKHDDSSIGGMAYYKALPGPEPGQTRYFLR